MVSAVAAREAFEAASNSLLKAPRPGAYLGFDPTADGLHIGHLAGVMALRQLQSAGFQAIALVGGATGLIGDPSGRSTERELLDQDKVAQNVLGLKRDLGHVLDFEGGRTKLVNNLDWYESMSAIGLLRDVGKHFRVGTMMTRESVKSRLGGEDGGLSLTEFAYQALQGYDFLHLYRTSNCKVQVGGSDQWGNIVGGLDLIRRVTRANDVSGLAVPLLTTKAGQKLGKSAGNAVWLSPDKTSDYEFYQYLYRVEDEDVEDLLLRLTEVDVEEIEATLKEHRTAPHQRKAQKLLAEQVTQIVRGSENVIRAQRATQVLFGKSIDQVSASDLAAIGHSGDAPTASFKKAEVEGLPIIELALRTGACASKSEARRLVKSNGLYLNNRRVEDENQKFDVSLDTLEGRVALLRTGKRNYVILEIV